jgi:nucleoside-diphosphate-sugar epimerase
MKLAQSITGIPAPRQVPPAMMKVASAVMGIAEKVVTVPDGYSSEYLRVSAGVTYIGSNAKARRGLGYNPRSLEEGLTETLRYEMQLSGMKEASRA